MTVISEGRFPHDASASPVDPLIRK